VICHDCGRAAQGRCLRCGRPYCEEHGGGPRPLCARCQEPGQGAPAGIVYHGSLLALVVAAAIGLWLLVSPPRLPGEGSGPPAGESVSQAIPAPAITPTPTPTPTPSPTPSPSPTPAFVEYEVQPGDTLTAIAQKFLPEGADLYQFIQRIAEVNGIQDPYLISPGQKLKIPQGP